MSHVARAGGPAILTRTASEAALSTRCPIFVKSLQFVARNPASIASRKTRGGRDRAASAAAVRVKRLNASFAGRRHVSAAGTPSCARLRLAEREGARATQSMRDCFVMHGLRMQRARLGRAWCRAGPVGCRPSSRLPRRASRSSATRRHRSRGPYRACRVARERLPGCEWTPESEETPRACSCLHRTRSGRADAPADGTDDSPPTAGAIRRVRMDARSRVVIPSGAAESTSASRRERQAKSTRSSSAMTRTSSLSRFTTRGGKWGFVDSRTRSRDPLRSLRSRSRFRA